MIDASGKLIHAASWGPTGRLVNWTQTQHPCLLAVNLKSKVFQCDVAEKSATLDQFLDININPERCFDLQKSKERRVVHVSPYDWFVTVQVGLTRIFNILHHLHASLIPNEPWRKSLKK